MNQKEPFQHIIESMITEELDQPYNASTEFLWKELQQYIKSSRSVVTDISYCFKEHNRVHTTLCLLLQLVYETLQEYSLYHAEHNKSLDHVTGIVLEHQQVYDDGCMTCLWYTLGLLTDDGVQSIQPEHPFYSLITSMDVSDTLGDLLGQDSLYENTFELLNQFGKPQFNHDHCKASNITIETQHFVDRKPVSHVEFILPTLTSNTVLQEILRTLFDPNPDRALTHEQWIKTHLPKYPNLIDALFPINEASNIRSMHSICHRLGWSTDPHDKQIDIRVPFAIALGDSIQNRHWGFTIADLSHLPHQTQLLLLKVLPSIEDPESLIPWMHDTPQTIRDTPRLYKAIQAGHTIRNKDTCTKTEIVVLKNKDDHFAYFHRDGTPSFTKLEEILVCVPEIQYLSTNLIIDDLGALHNIPSSLHTLIINESLLQMDETTFNTLLTSLTDSPGINQIQIDNIILSKELLTQLNNDKNPYQAWTTHYNGEDHSQNPIWEDMLDVDLAPQLDPSFYNASNNPDLKEIHLYANTHIQIIDLTNSPNIENITLDGINNLRYIVGLEHCKNLKRLHIADSTGVYPYQNPKWCWHKADTEILQFRFLDWKRLSRQIAQLDSLCTLFIHSVRTNIQGCVLPKTLQHLHILSGKTFEADFPTTLEELILYTNVASQLDAILTLPNLKSCDFGITPIRLPRGSRYIESLTGTVLNPEMLTKFSQLTELHIHIPIHQRQQIKRLSTLPLTKLGILISNNRHSKHTSEGGLFGTYWTKDLPDFWASLN